MLIQADARAIPLRDACVQCVVTSPPYFGLRDYGTARWIGGDPACSHFKLAGGTEAQGLGKSAAAMVANVERSSVVFREACGICGAVRVDSQIGLEESPEAYIATLVAVFREVRRVLKSDGVVWLNIGDSYVGGGITGPDLKPKDLAGIPWRVAFALQRDGWFLRADVIWAKPNPMPESVTDRPTRAHEYVFLLTKSARYFYDADAIREAGSGRDWLAAGGNLVGAGVHKCNDGYRDNGDGRGRRIVENYTGQARKDYESAGAQNPSDTKRRILAGIERRLGTVWAVDDDGDDLVFEPPTEEPAAITRGERYGAAKGVNGRGPDRDGPFPMKSAHMAGTPRNDGDRWREVDGGVAPRGFGRNKRSVWTVSTIPYMGAHFATMPERLVEPCILAGSRFGDLVFDPFFGSGTVPAVAERLGRRGIGTDLNRAYADLAKIRTAQRGLPFAADDDPLEAGR